MTATEIERRHSAFNKQPALLNLSTVDVTGDGNCSFRAASYILYGNESAHVNLRNEVCSYIENEGSIL
jgi:hypothetical protein